MNIAQGTAGRGQNEAWATERLAGGRRLETWIERTLLAGTSLSAALLVVGLFLGWAGGSGYPPGVYPRSISGIWAGLVSWRAGAWQAAGLAVLIATPFVRVLVAALSYLRNEERALAGVSLAVFALLMIGMFLGAAH